MASKRNINLIATEVKSIFLEMARDYKLNCAEAIGILEVVKQEVFDEYKEAVK